MNDFQKVLLLYSEALNLILELSSKLDEVKNIRTKNEIEELISKTLHFVTKQKQELDNLL